MKFLLRSLLHTNTPLEYIRDGYKLEAGES